MPLWKTAIQKKIDHLPKKNKKKRGGGGREGERQTDRQRHRDSDPERGGWRKRERPYEPLSEYVFKDHQTALQCFVFH